MHLEQRAVKLFWDFFVEFHRGKLLFESFYKRLHASFTKQVKNIVAFYKKAGFDTLRTLHKEYFGDAVRGIQELSKNEEEFGTLSAIERPLLILYHRLSIIIEHYEGIIEAGRTLKQESLQESDGLIRRYLKEVSRLLRRCSRGVDAVVKRLRRESLFLRSVYLHGDAVLGGPNGKREMLRKMFEHSSAEAYLAVAEDFYGSGFYLKARDTLEKVNRLLRQHRMRSSRDERIRERVEELSRKVDKAIESSLGEE